MGKIRKKNTGSNNKNTNKKNKRGAVAETRSEAVQAAALNLAESNSPIKFDGKFSIIAEKVREFKSTFLEIDEHIKSYYICALILKDLEILQILSTIKPINEILTFDEILKKIPHILQSPAEEDMPIKEFLKNIKNVPYENGQLLSENELVEKRSEIIKKIPANQKLKKLQAVKKFDQDYPSLFSTNLDYNSADIRQILKSLPEYNKNKALLGTASLIKALHSEGEIAAYYYAKAMDHYLAECENPDTKNLEISISRLMNINRCFRTETSSVNDRLLIDLCLKHKTHTKQEIFFFLDAVAQSSYKSGYVADAAITAELAYNLYINNVQDFLVLPKEPLAQTLYNLSKAIYLTDNSKGMLCLEAAYKLNPDSAEIKSIMADLGFTEQNYVRYEYSLLNIFTLLQESNLSQLNISDLLNKFNSIPCQNSDSYKIIQIVLDILQGYNQQALENFKELSEGIPYIQKKVDKLSVVLSFITKIENLDWKLFYDYLVDQYNNYPELAESKDTTLTYYKFILQIKNNLLNDASISLKNICDEKSPLDPKIIKFYITQAEELYISTLVEMNLLREAKEYITDSLHTQDLRSKFLSLINRLEQVKQSSNEGSVGEPRDIKEIASIINLADVTKIDPEESDEEEKSDDKSEFSSPIPALEEKDEEKIESLDTVADDVFLSLTPQEIHKYFQHLKANSLKSNPAEKANSSEHAWYLGNDRLDLQSSGIIKIPNKSNFYATIDPKLKFDSVTYDQLTSALEKGFVSRKINNNGIKLLGNNLIELKINGDIRLYTDIIYENPCGDHLIIFSKQGTHKDIARIAKNSTIKTFDVDSHAPNEFFASTQEFKQEGNVTYYDSIDDEVGTMGDVDYKSES